MLSYVFPLLGCKVGNEMEMEKGESRKRERGEEDILRSFICTMVPYLAPLHSLSSPLESLLMTHLLCL